MNLTDFDYYLPTELIANSPVVPRDSSRLMVVNKKTRTIIHDHFYNLKKYLTKNDVLVFNNSKVFPARLFGKKETGGKIEILLVRYYDRVGWDYISRPGIADKTQLMFDSGVTAEVVSGKLIFNIDYVGLMDKLETIGHIPLPPYITPEEGVPKPKLKQSYQTVYATEIGSVAAPTAGFHFTPKLLENLADMGVQQEKVTLHVGLGTFKPVKTEDITQHHMHVEQFYIPEEVVLRLKDAHQHDKRIVAVGTTSVRTLETWANTNKTCGDTDIFIYPGYRFKFVDAMITNFHLPKSTLLMLVSAFAGRDLIMQAYEEAIKEKYRFYSFGDAMLIV
jgi:S-adenosylmethionine:tRNA ribosyltransferase-isomerase